MTKDVLHTPEVPASGVPIENRLCFIGGALLLLGAAAGGLISLHEATIERGRQRDLEQRKKGLEL